MTEFRNNVKLPEFKLGINGSGLRSNQALLQRDMTQFYNKPIIVPKIYNFNFLGRIKLLKLN